MEDSPRAGSLHSDNDSNSNEVDKLPTGFAKIKDMAMLGIGAAFKCLDTYSDMALAYILYTGSYTGMHISWDKAD